MKKLVFTTLLYSLTVLVIAQKPKKVPTKAEMEKAMKQAEEAFKNMTPEQKKMYEEFTGQKVPTKIEIPKGFTDKSIKDAVEKSNRLIPIKDAARIASIEKIDDSKLASFFQKVQSHINNKVSAKAKNIAEQLMAKLKPEQFYGAAYSLWLSGKNEMALVVMAKAALLTPKNIDIQNNFAAMLTTAGGEQFALSLLDNLNSKYPNNSTVLNNLGQAWFGLGDENNAVKYLGAAIAKAPNHSQANATTATVEQAKGNNAAAATALKKSIATANSEVKIEQLQKLGEKEPYKFANWNFPKRDDNLGLGGFATPEFPLNVEESEKLEKDNEQYLSDLYAVITGLENKKLALSKVIKDETESSIKKMMATKKIMLPPFSRVAAYKFQKSMDNSMEIRKQIIREMQQLMQLKESMKKALEIKEKEINKRDDAQSGEGRANKSFCKERNEARNAYLSEVNGKSHALYLRSLAVTKQTINDIAHYAMFTTATNNQFEYSLISCKIDFLNALRDFYCEYEDYCKDGGIEEIEAKKKPIANFDDLHCPYKVEMSMPIVDWNFTITCNSSSLHIGTQVDFLGQEVGPPLSYDYMVNNTTGQSTHEISISGDVGKGVDKGPISVEVKAEAKGSVFIELDKNGVSDVGVKGEVKVGASATANATTVKQLSIDAGRISAVDANVRIGINSGASGQLKGILGNRNF